MLLSLPQVALPSMLLSLKIPLYLNHAKQMDSEIMKLEVTSGSRLIPRSGRRILIGQALR